MMIEVAAYIPSNQWRPDIEKYITCTSDGVVRLWSSTGQPLKTSVTLTGASAYVLCAAPFSKYNVVAIASNDHKIRFFSFEPRLRLDLEYDCGNCQAMAAHCFAVQVKTSDGADRTSLLAYMVWGDDHGCLHFVVEDALMGMRSATSTPTVHAGKVEKLNPRHFSTSLFSGWVTRIEFLTGAPPNYPTLPPPQPLACLPQRGRLPPLPAAAIWAIRGRLAGSTGWAVWQLECAVKLPGGPRVRVASGLARS